MSLCNAKYFSFLKARKTLTTFEESFCLTSAITVTTRDKGQKMQGKWEGTLVLGLNKKSKSGYFLMLYIIREKKC